MQKNLDFEQNDINQFIDKNPDINLVKNTVAEFLRCVEKYVKIKVGQDINIMYNGIGYKFENTDSVNYNKIAHTLSDIICEPINNIVNNSTREQIKFPPKDSLMYEIKNNLSELKKLYGKYHDTLVLIDDAISDYLLLKKENYISVATDITNFSINSHPYLFGINHIGKILVPEHEFVKAFIELMKLKLFYVKITPTHVDVLLPPKDVKIVDGKVESIEWNEPKRNI